MPRYRRILRALLGLMLLAALAGCGEGLLNGAPGRWAGDGTLPPSDSTDGAAAAADGEPAALTDDVGPDAGLAPTSADGAVADSAAPQPDATLSQPPTADCPRVQIKTDGPPANVRPTPDTSGNPVGTLANGTIVELLSIVHGETLAGVSEWYQIKSGSLTGYVFGTLVQCTTQQPESFSGFYLPFTCGKKVKVTQGNNTSFSHQGMSAYAFDFSLGVGSAMTAMAGGTVSYVYNKTKPGDPCYDGGGPSCIAAANIVRVKHPDGTQTLYAHLSSVSVTLGQKVTRGQILGKSGSTGYSTGPHAHVGRIKTCCQTIPLKFKDVPGSGVPTTGSYVVSGNCP